MGERKRRSIAKIDSRWFEDIFLARDLAKQQVAASIGMDPSTFSKFLRGSRRLTLEEARELARVLSVPWDEFCPRIGIKPLTGQAPDQLLIRGWVDGEFKVHWGAPKGPKMAPRPGFMAKGLAVVRMQTLGSPFEGMDGALVYYQPQKGVDPNCVGKFCLVQVSGGENWYLAVVKRGYAPGTYTLLTLAGLSLQTDVEIAVAYPTLELKF